MGVPSEELDCKHSFHLGFSQMVGQVPAISKLRLAQGYVRKTLIPDITRHLVSMRFKVQPERQQKKF